MEEVLSKKERLNLLNQYKILRNYAELQGDQYDIDTYNNYITILTYGYVREYPSLYAEMEDEFSQKNCDFVCNILRLYSNIYLSYQKLKSTSIAEKDILFPGFDENEEIDYLLYCQYILNDLKRFKMLIQKGRKDFVASKKCCDKYHKMYNKWMEMQQPKVLSEEQIKQLINL